MKMEMKKRDWSPPRSNLNDDTSDQEVEVLARPTDMTLRVALADVQILGQSAIQLFQSIVSSLLSASTV